MCPQCGCPGEAIKAAVVAADEAKRPKRIATIETNNTKGVGVLVKEGNDRFVIMDLFLLADSTTLTISALGSAKPLTYAEPSLSSDSRLLRFKVLGEPTADFFAVADSAATNQSPSYLSTSDQSLDPNKGMSQALVALDEKRQISGIQIESTWIPLHAELKWTAVKPSDLRQQVDLLAHARDEAARGQLSPQTKSALENNHWLTPFLSSFATQLQKTPTSTPKP